MPEGGGPLNSPFCEPRKTNLCPASSIVFIPILFFLLPNLHLPALCLELSWQWHTKRHPLPSIMSSMGIEVKRPFVPRSACNTRYTARIDRPVQAERPWLM